MQHALVLYIRYLLFIPLLGGNRWCIGSLRLSLDSSKGVVILRLASISRWFASLRESMANKRARRYSGSLPGVALMIISGIYLQWLYPQWHFQRISASLHTFISVS
jgi:hypothetical protein